MSFDLIVIGGGPAGYTGAIRAAKLGMSVALVEKDLVGGTCLNRGCIPTKALLHSSELFSSREDWAAAGIDAGNVTIDEARVYARKDGIVSSLRDGIISLLKAGKIAYYNCFGSLLGGGKVAVGEEILEGKDILLATGSSPARLPIKGIENALTSDDVLTAPVEADGVAIIGGGVIGCEFATYFAGVGKKVTVVEAMDRILPMMSKEISVQLSSVMKKKGVNIVAGAKVVEIGKDFLVYEKGGAETTVECGAVVVAIGRKANLDGLGLDAAGVSYDRFVKVDENMRTSAEGIYAAGDMIGKVQLAHYAAASAIAAVHAMRGEKSPVDLSVVPSCVYTSPEIATVGAVDFDGAKQGKFLLGANGKSLINGSNRGFIKLISDDKNVLRGAEFFGTGVTEMIGEAALAVKNGLSVDDVAGTIHAHPTVYEAIAEAAEDVFGLATHKR